MAMSSSVIPEHQDFDEDDWELEMEHLVTEDDTPVDNRFSERQQHLLPTILFASWPEGKPFEAVSNVGLFYSLHGEPPVVPDFMLSLGVEPRPVSGKKADRSYMTWVYGKAPDLVVEVVSNTKGGELAEKMEIYAKIRITYYAVFDPFFLLSNRELRVFRLVEGRYVEMLSSQWLPEIGLGLTVWEGVVGDVPDRWLRFVDTEGQMLPTSEEKYEREREKLDLERQKVEEERQKVEDERQKVAEEREKTQAERVRADRAEAEVEELRRKLKELGR